MNIKFIGAAREVTGSKHLITTDKGKKILLDCGMFQGKGLETDSLNRNLGFKPEDIDYLLLSHAHIDHSGLIPYIYKLGFRGSIICTNATRDLCAIMLADSAHIQELDVKWFNKKRLRDNLSPVAPIYTSEDVDGCMKLFISVGYNRKFYINDDIRVRFTHTGHMLGGAVVNLEITEQGQIKRIAYTGDIGRKSNRILHPPMPFPPCDYLITESTYGDRLHSPNNECDKELLDIVQQTCVQNRGKLIIPAFSVGRTQEIVFVLNNLYNQGLLPKVNVFIDSPLSVNATEVFRLNLDCMNDTVRDVIKYDEDPFGFKSLRQITKVEESKALNNSKEPCIIISSSGMLEAGRVKHHVANSISNMRNTILIVGYCSPTSLGARLQQPGLREISIFGQIHEIKARIARIDAFSGHGDYNEMIDFLACQDKETLREVFLVHGEYEVQQAYSEKLKIAGFTNIHIPKAQQTFDL
ncbi:MAG: MBL fold metallo-hydrolase [Porphyromonadaceae bacterium CG2_30_38_12]|nr:MAG: MBL fold metallo-hydrolase [Porphyromonadaceae bacterium CG2_30_38_12]